MARNRREQSDPRVIRDWIREGRGQGRNGMYKPWLNTQDVASSGIKDQLESYLTGDRAVQLLSGLETDAFDILAWNPSVVDIREQYPLLDFSAISYKSAISEILASTAAIAQELGIKHHADPKSKMPVVPTTDLLVTLLSGEAEHHHAFEIKPSSKLGSVRIQEKLELSRAWHQRRGHSWSLVTEQDIPKYLADNLRFLRGRSNHFSHYGGIPASDVTRIEKILLPQLSDKQHCLCSAAADCDVTLGLQDGTSLLVAYHFFYTRRWKLDLPFLMSRLDPGQPPWIVAPKAPDANANL